MNKKYLIYFTLSGLIICAVLFILASVDNQKSKIYYAHSGELNLSECNWEEEKSIRLNGEWEFYPDTLSEGLTDEKVPLLREVPHNWEKDAKLQYSPFGYGTYVLLVSGLKASELYGVNIIDEVTAYKLYVNDKEIISNGTVGTSKEAYEPCWRQKTGIFQADESGCARFVMEVANYDYYRGGIWNSPCIGEVNDILRAVQKDKIRETFLCSVIIIWGFINLSLFLMYKKDLATMYFSVFCFTITVYTSLVGQRLLVEALPLYNWRVLVRLEYFLGYQLLPLFGLFFVHLFTDEKYLPKLKKLFYTLIVFGFLIVVMPYNIYPMYMEPYKWLCFLFAIGFVIIIYREGKRRRAGIEAMLFGMMGMVLAILKEIFIGGVESWVPYASLVFLCCFTYIIFVRFLEVLRKKETLEVKVIRDPLTGLFNRYFLMDINLKSLRGYSWQKKYFMFLDLDDFKQVNDNYGHKIGDFILQEAGKRFIRILKSNDIICRYGGDEFVSIVFAESKEEIKALAERIIQEIRQPFEKDGTSYQIGVSIGVCPEGDVEETIDTYIKNSDLAMYQAKKAGKNRYVILEK